MEKNKAVLGWLKLGGSLWSACQLSDIALPTAEEWLRHGRNILPASTPCSGVGGRGLGDLRGSVSFFWSDWNFAPFGSVSPSATAESECFFLLGVKEGSVAPLRVNISPESHRLFSPDCLE